MQGSTMPDLGSFGKKPGFAHGLSDTPIVRGGGMAGRMGQNWVLKAEGGWAQP
jgi:hypothetical protein